MSIQSRQPQGTPVGGQFTAAARHRADLTLGTPPPGATRPVRADALTPSDDITLRDGTTTAVHGVDADPDSARHVLVHTSHGTHRYLAAAVLTATDALSTGDEFDEPPSCLICDGYGHGYPGAGPCPLEVNEQQRYETDEDEARAAWLNESSFDEPPF